MKLKRPSGEMDKRQVDHSAKLADQLTDSSLKCLHEALHDAGLSAPSALEPSLQTSFRRVTFAAQGSVERLTCDEAVRLSRPTGEVAQMSDDIVLVETKTEDGQGAADRELARLGVEEISLSKYRVGIGVLTDTGESGPHPGSELFAQL